MYSPYAFFFFSPFCLSQTTCLFILFMLSITVTPLIPLLSLSLSLTHTHIHTHSLSQSKLVPFWYFGTFLARSTSRKCPPVVAASDVDVESLQSSIAKHFALKSSCQNVCDDSSFSILSRGRSKYHLEVLEALYISKYQPDLCVQKNLLALNLFPPPA